MPSAWVADTAKQPFAPNHFSNFAIGGTRAMAFLQLPDALIDLKNGGLLYLE